jgi:type VI secretion system protein ImpE
MRLLPQKEEAVHGGTWNGKPFSEISDADPRIGANLEVFMAGSYTWIPIHYLRRLEIEPPANLRDLVWARARVETSAIFACRSWARFCFPFFARSLPSCR